MLFSSADPRRAVPTSSPGRVSSTASRKAGRKVLGVRDGAGPPAGQHEHRRRGRGGHGRRAARLSGADSSPAG
ncbi:hypothetical protein ABID44_003368 [Aquamicrobium ahrensii]|uniref:Uncharacterized protein n=1 Tax=Aquamicrobium ahrensii TaxID=469551 RepID=A0ABV2KPL1_9HYPH